MSIFPHKRSAEDLDARNSLFYSHKRSAEDFDARNDLLIPYYVYNILDPQDPVACAVKLFLAGDIDRDEDACLRTVDDSIELDDVDLLLIDLVEDIYQQAFAVHGNYDKLDVIARELGL